MYDEQTAKGKWCHITMGVEWGPDYCIASGCTAWRWKDKPFDGDGEENIYRGGYCGLAGKP